MTPISTSTFTFSDPYREGCIHVDSRHPSSGARVILVAAGFSPKTRNLVRPKSETMACPCDIQASPCGCSMVPSLIE